MKPEILTHWRIEKSGGYLRITNAFGHLLAGRMGRIPYHRFVLYEKLGRPQSATCHWCGYVLAWKCSLNQAQSIVVNADHIDNDSMNNEPENLVPACSWCNMNRNWAEKHPEFWAQWRRWLADVPPIYRPSLLDIADDLKICHGIKPS